MAPMAATAAAIRKNEQKIRRHRDDVNVDLEFGFVVIELPVRLDWLLVNRRGTRLYPKGQTPVKLFLRSLQNSPWETLSCEIPLANKARRSSELFSIHPQAGNSRVGFASSHLTVAIGATNHNAGRCVGRGLGVGVCLGVTVGVAVGGG